MYKLKVTSTEKQFIREWVNRQPQLQFSLLCKQVALPLSNSHKG